MNRELAMNREVVTLPEIDNFSAQTQDLGRKTLLEHVREITLIPSGQRVITALKKSGYMMTIMQLHQY